MPGGWQGDILIGTVTLSLNTSPHQPHRARITRMMTEPRWCPQGVPTALLVVRRGHGRGTAGLSKCAGDILAGKFPSYALKLHRNLTRIRLDWKRTGQTGRAG